MMGNAKPVGCLILSLLLLSCCFAAADNGAAGEVLRTPEATIATMPLLFSENQGQYEENVSYQARSTEQVITVLNNGIEFSQSPGNSSVFMLLDGSNPDTKIIGLNPINGTANYYYGSDPSAWISGVPLTAGVQYQEVYPGIDMNLSGTEGLLKSEFTVRPGADPAAIVLQYQGQTGLSLNETGDLVIQTPAREIVDEAPYAYQEINGTKVTVPCSYVVGENGTVSFSLESYDATLPLVIDPVLRYSLYFGGTGRDWGNSIAVDQNGYAYFIGTTWSDHLKYLYNITQESSAEVSAQGLAPGSVQPFFGGGDKDAFVIKIDPDGTSLVYITYIGGSGTDEGTGLVIDKEGSAYVVGGTNSKDFPVKNGYRDAISGGYDAWVAKLQPDGRDFVYSTFLGGEKDDFANAVTIDDKTNVFVTGQTHSWNFPVVNRYQLSPYGGMADAFITKLDPEGKSVVYSNFIGGSAYDAGTGITLDPNGYACIVGQTESRDLPVIKPYQNTLHGTFDAFVTKFDPEGKYPAAYSTYLGGSGWEDGRGIIALPDGKLAVVGVTKSTDFPLNNAIQSSLLGLQDGFLATLNQDGSALVESTYFGGTLIDSINGVDRDAAGNIFVIGTTDSPDLPVQRAYQSKTGGSSDAMIAKFTPDLSQTVFVTYLGGSQIEEGRAIAVTDEGDAYLNGYTESKNFPKVWPYQQNYGDGDRDAFVAVLSEHDMIPVTDFVGVPTEGDAPLTVQFTDKSLGIPTSWAWEFGDNTTSTEKNPVHTYQNPGVYTVSLTAKNIVSSQKKTKENYITVREPMKPPVADFNGVPQSGMVPLTVTFTDLSTNEPDKWLWAFGDSQTSAEKNPVHTYTVPGKYTVNLTVSNRAGTSSKEKPEFVNAQPCVIKPVADFAADPTSGMVPLSVKFTDLSKNAPTAWTWTFGDGTSANEQNPTHVYTVPGKYSVTLNVSNQAGSDQITKPELVNAQPSILKPIADFDAFPTSGPAPLSVQFSDRSQNNPAKWLWDFGDGAKSEERNPVHLYANPGLYTVSLTVTNEAGADTKVKPELINACSPVLPPKADFAGEPREGVAPLKVSFTDLSLNQPTSWLWNFGDGQTGAEKNPTHVYSNPGTYTVTLTVTNEAGTDTKVAQNYITVKSSVLPPKADFTANPTSGMAPLKVSFIDLSKNNPKQWYWKFGDGTDSIEQNPVHVYTQAGVYTVELTVSNEGGADTKVAKEFVTVNPPGCPPDAQFRGAPTTGTAPLAVSFTDMSTGAPATWKWNFGDGQVSPEQHPEHTYTTPGEYTVSLFVENQFGTSEEVRERYIRVLEKPVPLKAAFMGEPTAGEAPLTVCFTDLSTGGPQAWLWNFGDGKTSPEMNPTHVYEKAGVYTVFLTVTRGDERSSEIRYEYIHVSEPGKPPVPDFVASPTSGTVPLTVCFTDLTRENPTAWNWDFGDGGKSSEQNPTHVFTTPGTYTVCLEASNQFGSAKACKQNLITVREAPQKPAEFFGHITVDGQPACTGTLVEARGAGVETGVPLNPVTMSLEGSYGTPDPLTVKGTVKNGEMLTFWVKTSGASEYVQAECYDVYGGTEWTPSYPFRAGDKTRLDLRIGEAPIPPMPVLPHEFFGEVTYGGTPLEAGSVLIVKGDNVLEGHRGNPLPVTSPGVYGFGEMQKLVAQGELTKGQPLTFWIVPAGTNEELQAEVRDVEGGGDWMTTYPYIEGGLTRLEIRAAGGTPPVPIIPMTLSGSITLDDIPVVTGSLVTADGAGIRVGVDGNPVQISTAGTYGDQTKLTVQGDAGKGTPVTFTLYDAQSGREFTAEVKDPETGTWVQTYPFQPGTDLTLEMRAISVIPMATETN